MDYWNDVKHALRGFLKSPGFAVASVPSCNELILGSQSQTGFGSAKHKSARRWLSTWDSMRTA
jgi:hypothetical protein